MVKIVVLDDEFASEVSHEGREHVGRRGVQAQAGMPRKLGKNNVLMANPPLVKTHRKTHSLHREVCHQGNAGDVEDLLPKVGVQSEQRVGVLCQVVSTVELPKRLNLVHQTVVPVEPEVKNDAIETGLEEEPLPGHLGGHLARGVGEEDGEERSDRRGSDERPNNLGNAYVGDSVSRVLVAVEETNLLAHASQGPQLVDGIDLEKGRVE